MQKVVHFVGDDEKVVLDGELDQTRPVARRKRASAWVRVRGDEIHQARPKATLQRTFQRVHVEVARRPVGLSVFARSLRRPVEADDPQTVVLEHVSSQEVGWKLHDDDVARLCELRARQIDAVAHAVRDHEALRLHFPHRLLFRC